MSSPPQGSMYYPNSRDWQLREELEHCTNRAIKAEAEVVRLTAILNTPELIDFPKAVTLEAQHQLLRWGTEDREGKAPSDWFWLIGHLAGRALEHHKEAERLGKMPSTAGTSPHSMLQDAIAYHREKAVHHTITAAAALAHWHASIVDKATAMRPSAELKP